MIPDFGFNRPAAFGTVTTAQSSPGPWTALAEFLYQPGRRRPAAAAAPYAPPRPANDRHPPAKRSLDGACRFGLRLVGR